MSYRGLKTATVTDSEVQIDAKELDNLPTWKGSTGGSEPGALLVRRDATGYPTGIVKVAKHGDNLVGKNYDLVCPNLPPPPKPEPKAEAAPTPKKKSKRKAKRKSKKKASK